MSLLLNPFTYKEGDKKDWYMGFIAFHFTERVCLLINIGEAKPGELAECSTYCLTFAGFDDDGGGVVPGPHEG